MVTSNKAPEKKVVKMEDQTNGANAPPRTLLGEINTHLTCVLCRGYFIDATTIVECLHSFCRSCIIKHLQIKSYCPVCEMMINSARPNIKPDKALQDIVYKLVPGLFQREMDRRRHFYSSRPGPAASTTPEQRGEDTERIIFSPEDVISFSLEYADTTDTESVSSRSSDSSNEQTPNVPTTRRYLQCPAVVNISHLKKFLSMKFDIDCTQFSIDILYKRVPLPDYYTLMDIAYIYNWKRNEPMRFFYQIIDYTAIRSRYGLFDINRKGSHFRDQKPSQTPSEDRNDSPAAPMNEGGSEASSDSVSPMPDNGGSTSSSSDNLKRCNENSTNSVSTLVNKKDDEVEKSQFLNSFELTAKSLVSPSKQNSPQKPETTINNIKNTSPKKDLTKDHTVVCLNKSSPTKSEDSPTKRKQQQSIEGPEQKKTKNETLNVTQNKELVNKTPLITKTASEVINKTLIKDASTPPLVLQNTIPAGKNNTPENPLLKRAISGNSILNAKRKANDETPQVLTKPTLQPSKPSSIKIDNPTTKSSDIPKAPVRKIPDLRYGVPNASQFGHNKQIVNKIVRPDFLANNSDPTKDRRNILSQVKSSMGQPSCPGQSSGDALKTLFDSVKINIPSSLSITLTDQKQEQQKTAEGNNLVDNKKGLVNKNNPINSANSVHSPKNPNPPVHNYIEILKLPDLDPKKVPNRQETSVPQQVKPTNPTKTNDTPSAKGPVPSLKPIGDTKLGKQLGNFPRPTTFQQTFLQSLQQADKTKVPKIKVQVPKLMPAVPKPASVEQKDVVGSNSNQNKNKPSSQPEPKVSSPKSDSSVLDLSTPHTVTQSQLGPQQTKALETMQTIANLANKQSFPSKPTPSAQNTSFVSLTNKPLSSSTSSLAPNNNSQNKQSKPDLPSNQVSSSNRQELSANKSSLRSSVPNAIPISQTSLSNQTQSPTSAHSSPKLQTRSPSCSPKLVIAEDKQTSESSLNQSNTISSSQISSTNTSKSESPKSSPGPSKPVKPPTPLAKVNTFRFPITNNKHQSPAAPADLMHSLSPQLLVQHQAYLRHQMEIQSQIGHLMPTTAQWLKMNQARQLETIMKSMSSGRHQSQNDFTKENK